MARELLYGTDLAGEIADNTKQQVEELRSIGRIVSLATVLVGDDPASRRYIEMKHEEGSSVGIDMHSVELAADSSQSTLNGALAELSEDESMNALLVQYPLPVGLNYLSALSNINPLKDVDGLHPYNLGLLFHDPETYPGILPCTPNGIIQLLRHGDVELDGADITVVGRGMTVGAPLSMLLSARNNGSYSTVTTLHDGTKDLGEHTKNADVVIGAVGQPGLIDESMVREDATLVSVGVSYLEDGRARGDFTEEARDKAGVYVPVTRGIGPMTRANLWSNAVRCYELQQPEDSLPA